MRRKRCTDFARDWCTTHIYSLHSAYMPICQEKKKSCTISPPASCKIQHMLVTLHQCLTQQKSPALSPSIQSMSEKNRPFIQVLNLQPAAVLITMSSQHFIQTWTIQLQLLIQTRMLFFIFLSIHCIHWFYFMSSMYHILYKPNCEGRVSYLYFKKTQYIELDIEIQKQWHW